MFTLREQTIKMNRGENDIANLALESLEDTTGIKGKWEPKETKDFDGILTLTINNQKIPFYAEVKRELRNHQFAQILDQAKQHHPFIVIAQKIFPTLKDRLKEKGIAYLTINGNTYINHKNTIVMIEGLKTVPLEKENINRAFTKTGLKVLFHFLEFEQDLNLPYRDIARLTDVALANINYVINGLKEDGYLINQDKNNYKLIRKKELFERWIVAYGEKLKPALEIGKFRFLNPDDFNNWKHIHLANGKTLWGGEPATDMLINYLDPALLTLYTTESRTDLIKNYRLIPDPKGNVLVYKKFWNIDAVNYDLAPPLLVYADLINTNDPRCIDAANKLYEQVLHGRFE
jgi:hypothetical protein